MRTRVHVECDNPRCDKTGPAEFPDTFLEVAELKKVKDVAPPYGWLFTHTRMQGLGNDVEVVTCSLACVPAAVQKAWEDLDR